MSCDDRVYSFAGPATDLPVVQRVWYDVAAGRLELLRDSVQLALAYYVSRSSSGMPGSSRLARVLLVPSSLRTVPASFVKMVFFNGDDDRSAMDSYIMLSRRPCLNPHLAHHSSIISDLN